jgi:hypothetical protein
LLPPATKTLSFLLFLALLGQWGQDAHAGWATTDNDLACSPSLTILDEPSGRSSSHREELPIGDDSTDRELSWLWDGLQGLLPAPQQSTSSSSVNSHGPASAGPTVIASDESSQPPLTVRAAFELQFLLPRYLVTGIFRPPRIM